MDYSSRNRKLGCLQVKLTASETAQEDLRQINMTTSDELKSKTKTLEKISNDHSRLRAHSSKLHKEVRALRTKSLRGREQRSRAAKAAAMKAVRKFKEHSIVWRIKRPDGRIENWVRDLSCRLITVHHLPASQTPGAISDILQTIKANTSDHGGTDDDDADTHANPDDKETFSDRSARRFPLEGHVMGKIKLAREFKAAPGQLSDTLSFSCLD